ncbi:MAG: hypothetical protein HYU36_19885 [Planctomycetes bacterium]|nr:hypothetical protein [Planctomycetota bacterium]
MLLTPESERVGANFYRMMAGVYVAAALAGLSVTAGADVRAALSAGCWISGPVTPAGWGPVVPWSFAGLFVLAAVLCLAQTRPLRRWVWGILALLGLLAVADLVPLFLPSGAALGLQFLTAASFLASSLALGGVLSAMLLGHWYLVTPALSLRPLKALVALTGLALLAQGAVLAVGLYVVSSGPDAELVRLVTTRASFDALCFWVRVVVGLAGGVVLAGMAWHTLARWKATTAATGILYVAVMAVLIGEATGRYLLVFRQLPM